MPIALRPTPLATIATFALAGTVFAQQGKIIDAPGNIRAFSPDETSKVVDATDINLRRVMEDLGPDAITWYQHVQTLSNPFFQGREAGTRGHELTLEYLEFNMRAIGLEPAFPGEGALGGADAEAWSNYLQPFTYQTFPTRVFEVTAARMEVGGRELAEDVDFAVLANSGAADLVTAPLAFCGYAIANGPDDYDSFQEDVDLEGRIVMIFRYEPLNENGTSRWAERRFSSKARLAPKFAAIADRGAAGIIMVNPPGSVDGNTGLESVDSSSGFGRSREIPILQVTAEVAGEILEAADGRDLMAFRQLADSGELGTALLDDDYTISMSGHVETTVDRKEVESSNVGGVLRGKGNLADEWIVIGGHCDHVGIGSGGGMPGGEGQLHPGADDNASGTAGVLLLASRMVEQYAQADPGDNLRSVLFMLFGAEEVGLLGSAHYTSEPTLTPEQTSLMINLDMIGRLRDHTVMVGGVGSAEEMMDLIETHVVNSTLTLAQSPSGRGPSDHANFYAAGFPVLFMFTGMHDEYHRPGDHGYTVNPAGAIEIIDFVEDVAFDVASRPDQLTYTRVTRRGNRDAARRNRNNDDKGDETEGEKAAESIPATPIIPAEEGAIIPERETEEPPAPAGRTGGNVQLGIEPDYTAGLETGVLLAGVVEGTSADDAGLQGGDVILTWDDEEMTGLRRLAELLRDAEVGDEVALTVDRGGKTVEMVVKLKARQ